MFVLMGMEIEESQANDENMITFIGESQSRHAEIQYFQHMFDPSNFNIEVLAEIRQAAARNMPSRIRRCRIPSRAYAQLQSEFVSLERPSLLNPTTASDHPDMLVSLDNLIPSAPMTATEVRERMRDQFTVAYNPNTADLAQRITNYATVHYATGGGVGGTGGNGATGTPVYTVGGNITASAFVSTAPLTTIDLDAYRREYLNEQDIVFSWRPSSVLISDGIYICNLDFLGKRIVKHIEIPSLEDERDSGFRRIKQAKLELFTDLKNWIRDKYEFSKEGFIEDQQQY
jgi:hypothetical protein